VPYDVSQQDLICRKILLLKKSISFSICKVGGFQTIRDRAASLTVGDQMLVLGGRDTAGSDLISFEVYDDEGRSWRAVPEWEMAQGRYRLLYQI